MFFSPFLSLSLSPYLSTISIRVISYRISSSGFFYPALPYSDNNKREARKKNEGKGEREDRIEQRTISLVLRSCSLFFLYPASFIHNLFYSFSISLRLLSIKYYPEATRPEEEEEEGEETQHHTDCFDYRMKNGIKTSATQSRYPYTSMVIE